MLYAYSDVGKGSLDNLSNGQHSYSDFSALSRLAFLQECHEKVTYDMDLPGIPWKNGVKERKKEEEDNSLRCCMSQHNYQTNPKHWKFHRLGWDLDSQKLFPLKVPS